MKKPSLKQIADYVNSKMPHIGIDREEIGDMMDATFNYNYDPEAYDAEEYGSEDKADRAYSKDISRARKDMLESLQDLIIHFQPKRKNK